MINIAIDGPAGAGKSSIARYVAQQLGYIYVDTGALYRAIALFVLQRGTDVYDSVAVANMLPMIDVELRFIGGEQKVYLCGENVTKIIRTPEVSMGASVVSAIAKVREYLFDLQQEIAASNNVVMDGRDIGTVVLPEAQIKIYLTASSEERAKRRYDELIAKGEDVEFTAVLRDVEKRDASDMNRPIAPLRQAADAIRVDTTGQTFSESSELLLEIINRCLEKLK